MRAQERLVADKKQSVYQLDNVTTTSTVRMSQRSTPAATAPGKEDKPWVGASEDFDGKRREPVSIDDILALEGNF